MDIFKHPSARKLKALGSQPGRHPDSQPCDCCGKPRLLKMNRDLGAKLCSLACRRISIKANVERCLADYHGDLDKPKDNLNKIKHFYNLAAPRQQREIAWKLDWHIQLNEDREYLEIDFPMTVPRETEKAGRRGTL
jgi:hypothetical protein